MVLKRNLHGKDLGYNLISHIDTINRSGRHLTKWDDYENGILCYRCNTYDVTHIGFVNYI